MDKGYIQLAGIASITAVVLAAVALNQIEFAQNVGMVGIGAIAGFLGNEAITQQQ